MWARVSPPWSLTTQGAPNSIGAGTRGKRMGEAAVASEPADADGGSVAGSALFAPPEIIHERRPDGCLVLRSARDLGPVPRSIGVLLERWAVAEPGRTFLAERDGRRRVAASHLRGGGAGRRRHRPGPARPGPGARPAADDPGRQRHRPRPDDAGRHARRRAGGAGVDGLRAPEPGLRQAALHLRPGRAGPHLRRRCGALRQGAGSDRCHRHRDRRQPRQPRRPPRNAVRRAHRAAPHAGGRCRLRPRRARHRRQDPVHLRLHRPAQGRDQHAGHAVRQPGEHGRGLDRSSATTRP